MRATFRPRRPLLPERARRRAALRPVRHGVAGRAARDGVGRRMDRDPDRGRERRRRARRHGDRPEGHRIAGVPLPRRGHLLRVVVRTRAAAERPLRGRGRGLQPRRPHGHRRLRLGRALPDRDRDVRPDAERRVLGGRGDRRRRRERRPDSGRRRDRPPFGHAQGAPRRRRRQLDRFLERAPDAARGFRNRWRAQVQARRPRSRRRSRPGRGVVLRVRRLAQRRPRQLDLVVRRHQLGDARCPTSGASTPRTSIWTGGPISCSATTRDRARGRRSRAPCSSATAGASGRSCLRPAFPRDSTRTTSRPET